MYTISDVITDINRGCMCNNMVEDKFLYRIIFFVNERNKSSKHYIDTTYGNLRKSLEGIIRNHLSMTNNIVIAQTTILKNERCVYLQSKSYSFSLEEYFKRINGEYRDKGRNESIRYSKCAVR